MLAGLLSFAAIWLAIDAIIIMAACFAAVIHSRYPDWWRRVIADKAPTD